MTGSAPVGAGRLGYAGVVSVGERVLAAAVDLFHAKGYHAVSVDEIGSRAGTSGPAVYRHFAGKQEILTTLFDRAIVQLDASTEQLPDDAPARLRRLVDVHTAFVLADGKLAGIRFREERTLPEQIARRYRRWSAAYIQRWVDCLQELHPARDQADVRATAYAALGMLNSINAWQREAKAVADTRRFFGDLAIAGMHAALD